MRLRYFIAPLIVFAGIGLASIAHSIETNANIKKHLQERFLFEYSQSLGKPTLTPINPKTFNLKNLDSFYDINLRMEASGFVPVAENVSIACFGSNLFCEGLSTGSALYASDGDKVKLVTLYFKHKRTLNGCQPSVSQMYHVDFEKDE